MEQAIMINEASPLAKLVDTLEYQNKIKADYVIPAGSVRYDGLEGLLNINGYEYGMTDHTHDQFGTKLEIPAGYYNRMRNSNQLLLASNINSWLSKKENTKYLLRTFEYGEDGIQNICRAMLSNRYSIMDNFDVLVAALEAIKKTGIHVEIVKAEVTERRMYLHIVAPEIHVEATELLDGYMQNARLTDSMINKGIISGIILTNSEVGLGTFEVGAAAQIIVCKNRMIDRSSKFRKVHLGGRMETGIVEWSTATKNKNYELIISQVQDAVKIYLSKEYLGQLTTKLMAHKEQIVEHPSGLIERVSTELNIPQDHKDTILKYFLKDSDDSNFGMLNAITRYSQKMGEDIRYELEARAFDMLPRFESMDKPISKN